MPLAILAMDAEWVSEEIAGQARNDGERVAAIPL
jgi:hypothetical protein